MPSARARRNVVGSVFRPRRAHPTPSVSVLRTGRVMLGERVGLWRAEMADTRRLKDIVEEALHSLVCICGGEKEPTRSFCIACYKALPASLRTSLNISSGNTFYQVWDECADYLKIETDRIPR